MAAIALLALVAGLVLAWHALVPAAAILVGGLYGSELAIEQGPLDVAAPAVAVGLLLAVELAYWSLEERVRWVGAPGDGARRAAVVMLMAAAAVLLGAILVALVDAARTKGLAVDVLGAMAAAAVLIAVLAFARSVREGSS